MIIVKRAAKQPRNIDVIETCSMHAKIQAPSQAPRLNAEGANFV